jgi:acyl CoA:acetate/3-ketoacid CoA transferase
LGDESWNAENSEMDSLFTAKAAMEESNETIELRQRSVIARRSTFGLMNKNQVKNSLNLRHSRPLLEGMLRETSS